MAASIHIGSLAGKSVLASRRFRHYPGAMDPAALDAAVRKAAFDWLEGQTAVHGDVLPRALLARGFEFRGQRVPLVSPQGIFTPKVSRYAPLTITTVPEGPYEDNFSDDHRLLYRYRGTDPGHRDNVGLRTAMRQRLPLIYLFGLVPGRYVAVWPVYVVGDDPQRLCFTVIADDTVSIGDSLVRGAETAVAEEGDEPRREYITATVQRRLHQRTFRERVLQAYSERCALCRLGHRELLDAGHIIPDNDPRGEPRVTNGLALCKIHHTAFDRHFLGVRPDAVIQIRADLLAEKDGPMLLHGLQALHGRSLTLPRRRAHRPDQEALAIRFERFLEVQG